MDYQVEIKVRRRAAPVEPNAEEDLAEPERMKADAPQILDMEATAYEYDSCLVAWTSLNALLFWPAFVFGARALQHSVHFRRRCRQGLLVPASKCYVKAIICNTYCTVFGETPFFAMGLWLSYTIIPVCS